MPILVLLDEIDRMQRDELLVLLKILRGASSIPNVTFICAFSEEHVKRELDKEDSLSHDYLEKFFPVSIRLSPPAPELVARCVQSRLTQRLAEQKWFRNDQDEHRFAGLLKSAWTGSMDRLCTNLRTAGRLLNDVDAAGQPIVGEVNPFDLVVIEAIRRFYPRLYQMVRTGGEYLTGAGKNQLSTDKQAGQDFFAALNKEVNACREPGVARDLLSWIFPEYARANNASYLSVRRTSSDPGSDDRRICYSDYFRIYFRASVPEEMFSNAELNQLVSNLNRSTTEDEAKAAFRAVLDSVESGHAKRGDFLWKLARGMRMLTDSAAENVAYAVAACAADYQYDIMHFGEGAEAVNIVFAAAQKLAATELGQRVLAGALLRASNDTFAIRLLELTEESSRNNILTDFSNIDVPGVQRAFLDRMRYRYSQQASVDLSQSDWRALHRWVENSDADRDIEQDTFRRFIGQSRKRLAQVINVVYPGGPVVWSENPSALVNAFFPIEEIKNLLRDLPTDEVLLEDESSGIERMQELFEGKYRSRP
jgi:hypothetical protein